MMRMTTSNPARSLAHQFEAVHARIAAACARSGRHPDEVKLIAVSKTVDCAAVHAAARLPVGLAPVAFGENRVQELVRKIDQCPEAVFHLIGTLQRNKVSKVAGRVALIHSVDSLRLLEAIATHAHEAGVTQDVLLQVNVSGEQSKHGIAPDEVATLLEAARTLDGVRVIGLMTMAPFGDPETARPYFRALRQLAAEHGLAELSMGMSGDFEVAIEEGATLVRIGSALFAGTQERI